MNMKMIAEKTVDLHDFKNLRQTLSRFFTNTVELEERLFNLLKSDEAFYERPEPLRHPLIFYFGHTFTFYINKFYAAGLIKERLNSKLEAMLAIGVDEMSWDDLNEDHYDWPLVSEVRSYRKYVGELVQEIIAQVPQDQALHWDSPYWVVPMALEHHRIHLETSSVLIRQLGLEHIRSDPMWAPCPQSGVAPANELVQLEGQRVVLGKDWSAKFYGWDNEYGREEFRVKNFSAAKYLVSNGEFLGFVSAGGYQQDKYWSDEGNNWRHFKKAAHPIFWRPQSVGYKLRVLEREIDLPLNWPVEVNYLEAEAFCRWKGESTSTRLRLPTEAEWHVLKNLAPCAPANINLEYYASPCPVDEFKMGDFYDVIGNVWQWGETTMHPFEGFKVHPLYDDFTVPTFDGKHNLIHGGSFISTGNLANMESRYAFRRHFFQHAGFRYVESPNVVKTFNNTYETDVQLGQYCEFHYGDKYFGVPNFPAACIAEASRFFPLLKEKKRALDLGCAVGRSSFELAKSFEEVTGIDYSARFIAKAQQVLEERNLRYALASEGEIMDFYERDLKSLGLAEDRGKIEFMQGDACNLAAKYGPYDLIFAGNLIDRLHSPRTFLAQIHQHMNVRGLLILCSPYTWLEEFTPREEWLGGLKRDGENFTTLQGLRESLQDRFKEVASEIEIPFVIRETKRKFQHSVSEMSVWQLKE